MSILTGEYNYTVDAKNRIRIPAKLKADMGIDVSGDSEDEQKKFSVILHTGAEGYLGVFTQEALDKKFAHIEELKERDKKKYESARKLLRTYETVESDPQGRVVIPQKFKIRSNIKKDIVICGVIDHLEIWAKEEYSGSEITPEEMAEISDELDL